MTIEKEDQALLRAKALVGPDAFVKPPLFPKYKWMLNGRLTAW